MQRSIVAMKSSFFVPKRRKTYGSGDRLRRAALEPVRGELDQGGFEDLLTPFLGAPSLCDCHDLKLAITH